MFFLHYNTSILFHMLAIILPRMVFHSVYSLMHSSVTQTGVLHAFCLEIGIPFCIRVLFTFHSLSMAWVTSLTSQIPVISALA